MTSTKPSPEFRAKLFEQLAERLRLAGAPHPVAATVALAARGDTGLGASEFAIDNSIPLVRLESIERGELDLASTLDEYAACLPGDIDVLLTDSLS